MPSNNGRKQVLKELDLWDKKKIVQLLTVNNLAVERAIVCIYHRQTLDEQSAGETKHSNGIGFSAAHSRLGTYYAKWLLNGKHLNNVHLEKARNITIQYTGQLLEIIKINQS